MQIETATVSGHCPHCSHRFSIAQRWTAGGTNDYGGYVLQCLKCNQVFAYHLGRDINDSTVTEGAKVLDSYDNELGNKDEVLARHRLAVN